jgi:hypothetical protein
MLTARHEREDTHPAICGHEFIKNTLPPIHGHDPNPCGVYVETCKQVHHTDLTSLKVQLQPWFHNQPVNANLHHYFLKTGEQRVQLCLWHVENRVVRRKRFSGHVFRQSGICSRVTGLLVEL